MRKKLLGLLIAGAFLAPAGASAATLTWTGTLSFGLSTLPALVVPASGTAVVNGSGVLGHLNTFVLAGGDFGPANASLVVTASATVNSVRFTNLGNGAGTMTGITAGAGGGLMGLAGIAKICLVFDPSCQAVSVPVPLAPMGGIGFGVGGTQLVPGVGVSLTLQHSVWTIGQPSMTIHNSGTSVTTPVLAGGFVHGAQSLTSTTALKSGTVQIVTATKAYTSLTGAFPELPLLATVNLHFTSGEVVPEPGTLLLLGAGVAGLVAVGRKKRS